jgi:hypothetical protein
MVAVSSCLAALALPVSAGAVGLHPAAPAAGHEVAQVAKYWTPARMSSAQPLEEPAGRQILSASVSFGPVPEPTVLPNAVNGRLFLRQGRAEGYCSATAINSPTRRLILTAGHCVNSGPRSRKGNPVWSRFLEFVPAYDDGVAPFGAFIAHRDSVYAARQWVRFANPNFDIGAILTSPNAEGVNVADAVGGGVTIATDRSRQEEFQTFGYPGKSHSMQTCNSPYVGDDARTYPLPGPPTMAIRCHWAPGASGGGWLVDGGTVIDGLTTYGTPGDRIHTFGPYFSRRNVGHLVAGL